MEEYSYHFCFEYHCLDESSLADTGIKSGQIGINVYGKIEYISDGGGVHKNKQQSIRFTLCKQKLK